MLRPLLLLAGLGVTASIAPALTCLPARADSVQFRSTVSEVDACNRAQALVPKNGIVTGMKLRQENDSNGSYAFYLPGELERLHQGQTHLDANPVWPGVELKATGWWGYLPVAGVRARGNWLNPGKYRHVERERARQWAFPQAPHPLPLNC
jgi:hypothetical protein